MLEIQNLHKSYNGRTALKTVDLAIGSGEIVGLFGSNGAGKTTLLKCILQLLRYDGRITLDGCPINRKNIARLSFGTSEHSFFPNLTAEDHREFYKLHFPAFSDRRFRLLMDFFSLPRHRLLRTLSTGQKNQFEVILALSQGADYILLDEPFAGNDIFNREDFYKVLLGLLEPSETLILSTHLIDEVENFVSRAVVLKDGTVAADVQTAALEDSGRTLSAFIKETYAYQPSRARDALFRTGSAEAEGAPDEADASKE